MNKTNSKAYHKAIKTPPERFFDEYRCLKSWQMTPMTESFIQKMAEELLIWAIENDDALKLDEWQIANGICDETKQRWLTKYPNFKIAWQHAKKALGIRREKGVIKKKYDSTLIAPMMFHYDSAWKEIAEWREGVKATARAKAEAEASIDTQIKTHKTIHVDIPVFNEEPPKESRTPEETARWARKGYPMTQKRKKDK